MRRVDQCVGSTALVSRIIYCLFITRLFGAPNWLVRPIYGAENNILKTILISGCIPNSVRDWSQHSNLHSGILLETVTRRFYVPDTRAQAIFALKHNAIKPISIRYDHYNFKHCIDTAESCKSAYSDWFDGIDNCW